MLELQKKHHAVKMERDKELYERQIKIVDMQIDRLVYDMYELTEEIKIIESMSYVMPTYGTMTAPTTLWH